MVIRTLQSLVVIMALGVANVKADPEPLGSAQEQSLGNDDGVRVLFLGDSLALCGFGHRLDQRFRSDPRIGSVFSYMACGTNPLSWLKEKPYANVKTRCGFWSIESGANPGQPKVSEDIYGMGRGGVPGAHDVPKIEDLLASTKPTVIVMQNENNLFDVFGGRSVVNAGRDRKELRRYIAPFIAKLLKIPSPARRLYWIGSPINGRISKEVQDFTLQQIRDAVGQVGMVIDSRPFVSYPYRHMEPDKEHFIGQDMDQWADRVYETIQRDLDAHPLASSKLLTESSATVAELPKNTPARAESPLQVTAKLVFKSEPIPLDKLLPYQESLVTFIYDVKRVARGQYTEKQIAVAHPACIALKMQPLDKLKIGKMYKLRLRELRSTTWNTAKTKDDSGQINLEPYIRVEDERKFPGAAH